MLGKWNIAHVAGDWLIPVAVLIGAIILGWIIGWIRSLWSDESPTLNPNL